MSEYNEWTEEEAEKLVGIAIDNNQVYCILKDLDIKTFYEKLLRKMKLQSKNANKVKYVIKK